VPTTPPPKSPACRRRVSPTRRGVLLATLGLLGGAVRAQTPAPVDVVDEETDTPYVPTPRSVVERMLEIAGVGPSDYLIDLGSGDGRIVLTAATKFGARGHGIDIDPRLVRRSQEAARKLGVADRAQFRVEDIFEADFSRATVISAYLLPKVMQLLTPKLANLAPGTRIVSHDYPLAAEWRPDFSIRMFVPDKPVGRDKHSTLMLWTVPARVAGAWRFDLPGQAASAGRVELRIEQNHQVLKGTATLDGQPVDVLGLRVDGDRLRFALEPVGGGVRLHHAFDGRVRGDRASGNVVLDGEPQAAARPWQASRG
jgi:hypothetical protein